MTRSRKSQAGRRNYLKRFGTIEEQGTIGPFCIKKSGLPKLQTKEVNMSTLSASATATTSNCHQCLICLKKTDTSQNSPGRLEKDDALIERQFSIVYLVNKLLEIPSEVCANYLSKFGNPEEWISICGDCSSLVGQGRQLFNQIKRLERKHKAIGEELRLKMKVKLEEEEQSILGQSAFEIRHYLDTLDDLKEEQDLGIEKDYTWLIMDVDDSSQKLNSKEKKMGKKRKSEQEASSLRPKRNVSKPAKCSQEKQFSEAEEEAEMELNLEENYQDQDPLKGNFEDENPLDKNCEDQDPIGDNFEEDLLDENREVEDPLVKCFKDSYYNIKNEDPPQKVEKVPHQSNISCLKAGCQSKFARRPNLLKHMRKFHPQPKVELSNEELAAEPLSFKEVLKKHEEMVAKLETEPDQEGQRANNKESLSLARLALIHKVKEFMCQGCRKVYLSFAGWNKHYNGEIGICRQKAEERIKKAATKFTPKPLPPIPVPGIFQGVVCEELGCDKVFGQSKGLEYHMRSHLDKEELRCKGCSYIYNTESTYYKHYSTSALYSDPSNPCVLNGVKCGQCHLVYSSQASLEVHQKMRHAPNRPQPSFKCLDCGQVLSSKSGLRLHIATQHDPSTIGLYPCRKPECSKSFRTKGNLQVHLRYYHAAKEGKEKKFKCHFENCTSAFYTKAKLTAHLKIHNPENPVVCEICGKGFKMQSYLTIHSWQHDPAMRHKYKEYRDNKLAKKRRLEQEQQASE